LDIIISGVNYKYAISGCIGCINDPVFGKCQVVEHHRSGNLDGIYNSGIIQVNNFNRCFIGNIKFA